MNDKSNAQNELGRVLEKVQEIVEKSADGNYIFRGEPECYGKVSSNLYRFSSKFGIEDSDIKGIESSMASGARVYLDLGETISNFEILAELQHHGGKTNLIDFTADYLIALFFACDGSHSKNGRVILLKKESKDYVTTEVSKAIERAKIQKSILVQSSKGFIEPKSENVVIIPAALKRFVLTYLLKYHNIGAVGIYNDIQGYIKWRNTHLKAQIHYYQGLTYRRKAYSAKNREEKQKWYEKTLESYTEALRLKPDDEIFHMDRAETYADKGEFERAIQDYTNVIKNSNNLPGIVIAEAYYARANIYFCRGEIDNAFQDYNKNIELNPNFSIAFCRRAVIWLHKREWEKAKSDLKYARDVLKMNNITTTRLFHTLYENIEDFEQKNNIQLPEDIKAMLTQR